MSPTRNTRRARARQGFTLMEIMVVIAIIGLLMTLVAPQVYNRLREANVTATKAKMANIIQPAIEDYKRHHGGKVPDSLQELTQPNKQNLGEPYLTEDQILDAWQEQFVYTKISGRKFELYSYGADGMDGGEADEADIYLNKSNEEF